MMNWYVPITIIPGVALLVLSTSNFIVDLSQEIQRLNRQCGKNRIIIEKKISQLSLLSKAITCFYACIAIFTLSGLIKGWMNLEGQKSEVIANFFIAFGIIILLSGIVLLTIYAGRAVQIRKLQFRNILNDEHEH